jgi:hypothetical protein
VLASISFDKENVTIDNNNGNVSYQFTSNGEFTFTYHDQAGNTGSAIAKVDRIDKTPPHISSLLFIPASLTKEAVVVHMTVDEPITTPQGWTSLTPTSFTRSFTENTGMLLKVDDLVGNSVTTGITIDRIDTTPPEILQLAYVTLHTGSVEVLLRTNEPIVRPLARSGTATGTVFTRLFAENISTELIFHDLAGNQATTGILIDRIDTTALQTSLLYTPETPTSGTVTATLTFNKTGILITNSTF